MKCIISAHELLRAVDAIDLVPSRAGITPSEFVQIEKKRDKLYFALAAEVYGKTVAASTIWDKGDWVFHVDRTSFMPFVQVVKTFASPADFKFFLQGEGDDAALIVKSGRRKVVFNAISFVQGYPKYTADDSVTIPLTKQQKELLQLASRYASPDPTLAYINTVWMRDRRAVYASNRISLFYGRNRKFPISVPLPLMLLGLLDNDIVRTVEVAKSAVKLVLSCGYICQAINATARKDFPLKSSIQQFKDGAKLPLKFSVKGPAFITAVSRLEMYIKGVNKDDPSMTLECEKNSDKLLLYCDTPAGRFTEMVTLQEVVKESVKCEWQLYLITPLGAYIKRIHLFKVHYDDKEKSPYYIESDVEVKLILSRKIS